MDYLYSIKLDRSCLRQIEREALDEPMRIDVIFQRVVFEHNTPSVRSTVFRRFQSDRPVTHSIRATSVEVRAASLSPFTPRYIPAGPSTALWNDDPSMVAVACSQSCHRAFQRIRASPLRFPSRHWLRGNSHRPDPMDFSPRLVFAAEGRFSRCPASAVAFRVYGYLYVENWTVPDSVKVFFDQSTDYQMAIR